MGLNFFTRNPCMFFLILHVLCLCSVLAQPNVFDLISHGGSSSNNFDNSKALASAWNEACKSTGTGEARVVIPQGTYFSNPVELLGPCKRPMRFTNKGILVAPPGPMSLEYWLRFRNVDGFVLEGGSFLGRGNTVWDRPSSVNPGHSLVGLASVKNAKVLNVKLKDSKKVHLLLFACSSVDISRVTVDSPETSPNTDGIKMGSSDSIRIHDSNIMSGDDCLAILTGTSNLNVTRVWCGPGHGISIGSMGTNPGEEVKQVRVTNCTLTGTLNGVRIKSKPNQNQGLVSDVTFRHIIMDRAQNPIIIDQSYCPDKNCPKVNSRVQIDGVTFDNIYGTSATEVAVNLQCSGSNPCKNIRLKNIDLSYLRRGAPASGICSNVNGFASGVQRPKSCL